MKFRIWIATTNVIGWNHLIQPPKLQKSGESPLG